MHSSTGPSYLMIPAHRTRLKLQASCMLHGSCVAVEDGDTRVVGSVTRRTRRHGGHREKTREVQANHYPPTRPDSRRSHNVRKLLTYFSLDSGVSRAPLPAGSAVYTDRPSGCLSSGLWSRPSRLLSTHIITYSYQSETASRCQNFVQPCLLNDQTRALHPRNRPFWSPASLSPCIHSPTRRRPRRLRSWSCSSCTAARGLRARWRSLFLEYSRKSIGKIRATEKGINASPTAGTSTLWLSYVLII